MNQGRLGTSLEYSYAIMLYAFNEDAKMDCGDNDSCSDRLPNGYHSRQPNPSVTMNETNLGRLHVFAHLSTRGCVAHKDFMNFQISLSLTCTLSRSPFDLLILYKIGHADMSK
jgi:hypothetical protein